MKTQRLLIVLTAVNLGLFSTSFSNLLRVLLLRTMFRP